MEKIILLTITQHGFYKGIDSTQKYAMSLESVKDFLTKKIREDYDYLKLNDNWINNYVDAVIKNGHCIMQFSTGSGNYETTLEEIEFIK